MNNWINFAVFGKLMDYLFVKSLLESEDIVFFVENEHVFYSNPVLSDYNSSAYLYVYPNQYEKAKKLLIEHGYQECLRE